MRWTAGLLLMALTKPPAFARALASPSPSAEANRARTMAGDWHADRYSTNAAFVPELGKKMLDLLAPVSGERILDVGCGDGVLTAELKARGCKVVGIDFAPDMVTAAVKKGLKAYVMDASAIDAPFLLSKIAANGNDNNSTLLPSTTTPEAAGNRPERGMTTRETGDSQKSAPPGDSTTSAPPLHNSNVDENSNTGSSDDADEPPRFDAVFSNAALHWVRAPRTAIEGAKRVLRPGGRFVGEFGGHGNVAAIRVVMHAALWRRGIDPLEVDPWYFPTPQEYRCLLESAGFIVDDIVLVPRPTILPAGTGMRGWLSMFTRAFWSALPKEPSNNGRCPTDSNGLTEAEAVLIDEALAALQPALRDSKGIWTADYVRLRFRAHLPHDCASDTAVPIKGEGLEAGTQGSK